MSLAPRVFRSVPISTGAPGARHLRRADIEVAGLDQAGPSYELRVFLNNPDADAATEPTHDNGYVDSIYVYGYGQLPEGAGGRSAETGAQPRVPMTRSVIATDAVRRAAAEGPTASVTLVPVAFQPPEPDVDLDDVEVSVLVDEQLP